MGQAEILKLLKKENRWMSTREICEKLKQGRGLVCRSALKLWKLSEVRRKYFREYNCGRETLKYKI